MKKLLVSVLLAACSVVGTVAANGCAYALFNEPEMPESLD